MLIPCVAIALLVHVCAASTEKKVYVTWHHSSNKFTVHSTAVQDVVATATFVNAINATGWSYLEVWTNETFPDSVQAYCAGLAEGASTADLVKKHWYNSVATYCDGEESYCDRLKSFLETNLDFMNYNIARRRKYVPYWHQVALALEQLSGLEDGYNNVAGEPRTRLNVSGLLMMNIFGDLEDLESILNKTVSSRVLGSGSCSGLIKLLPNNEDLYFSHDTWNTYSSMLRILKKYNISVHSGMDKGSPLIPGQVMSFSSYPGLICSGDDFYLISSGLATMETTIGNGNSSLWKYIRAKGTVLEWLRSIVANRMGRNGREWSRLFSVMNSGTYNNQWMIVDYNKFLPSRPLQNDLLWVLEQLPGYIHSDDVTDVLRKQGYWPSYNTPYFKDIYNLSGSQESADKYGDWFTYDRTPRALIFKRDHRKVVDVNSMIKLMRYNDYTHDPLSRCNCTPPYSAENAVSARCDLNPANGTYAFGALGHRPHGGTDMKLTTASLFKNFQFVAYGGPTYDSLPPFKWSDSDFRTTLRHEGHPDLWQFKPIIHKWSQ